MSSEEKPKIIQDEDWKAQAQKEKEKLSEDQEPKSAEQPGGAGAGAAQPLPPTNFMTLVNMLAIQALLYMGKLSDPNSEEGKEIKNLDLAKHHIDLLGILEEKTKGNLTDEESNALAVALHEARMSYVQAAS